MTPYPAEGLPPTGGSTDPVHTGRVRGEDFAAELVRRLGSRRTTHPRYERLERVAQGGMGTIYRVRDIDLHRDLAMKVLGSGEIGEPVRSTPASLQLARFVEEAQVTGQLDHPGIVPVHELGLDAQDHVFFTMKLVRGQTLREVLELLREGREGWSTTRVVGVLLRVCEAMAYAHDKRVIHRDLKPSNLMVGRFGEVYVMDWGLARVLDRPDPRDARSRDPAEDTATQAVLSDRHEHSGDPQSPLYTMDGQVFGTPAYMPPEQARGDVARIGTAADVYAIGAILYHVLAGCVPYGALDEHLDKDEVWQAVKQRPPLPLAKVAPGAPPELVAICELAMRRDPKARYASMQALADELRAYLENRVVHAHKTGPVVELRKWIARNRGAAAGLALALLVSLGGVLVWALKEAQRAEVEHFRHVLLAAPELISRAQSLGPVDPASLPLMQAWLEETEQLLESRERYERELAAMRADAERSGRARRSELEPDPEALFAWNNAKAWVAELERSFSEALAEASAPEASEREIEALSSAERVLPAEIAWWSQRAALLAPAAAQRVGWQYDDAQRQRRDAQIAQLVGELDLLAARTLPEVRARAEQARTLRQLTLDEPAAAAAWNQARESILDPAQCPPYAGKLELAPQLGLLPLGRSAHSGLWEFWVVQSGERPLGDGRGGWIVGADTGIVLVLIPGGRVVLGAQREDPGAPCYDPYASLTEKPWECELEPYFISKYEMTQAQWLRATGELPCTFIAGQQLSGDPRITRSNPVESVDFARSREVLLRIGLDHPSSAQWERAARGGVDAALGAAALPSVEGRATNRWDSRFDHKGELEPKVDAANDDGFAFHAPVGSFPPNPYGLHEMLGNVSEWCLDWIGDSRAQLSAPEPGTGLRTPDRSRKKISRGGDHARHAPALRPSALTEMYPDQRDFYQGVRPARRLVPVP